MSVLKDQILSQFENLWSGKFDLSTCNQNLDSLFGFSANHLEKSIARNQHSPELYLDEALHADALSTSYLDFANIFQRLPINEGFHFVDLGAGYGRSVLLLSQLYPQSRGTAIEVVQERLLGAQDFAVSLPSRFEFSVHDLMSQDLKFPVADAYFIYQPVGPLLEQLLAMISEVAMKQKIFLIAVESHGDLMPRLQAEPWLQLRDEFASLAPRHDPMIRIYVSRPSEELSSIMIRDHQLERQFSSGIPVSLSDKEPKNFFCRFFYRWNFGSAKIKITTPTQEHITALGLLKNAQLSYYNGQPYISFGKTGKLCGVNALWNTEITHWLPSCDQDWQQFPIWE